MRPREWEIPVQDPVEPDQPPAPPPPPPGPPVAPAPEPAPAPGGESQAERGDPGTPAPIAPPPQPAAPVELERQARSRRPPGYLADYHVGPVDLAPQGQNSPSTGSNPHSYGPRYPPRDTTIEFTYQRSADTESMATPVSVSATRTNPNSEPYDMVLPLPESSDDHMDTAVDETIPPDFPSIWNPGSAPVSPTGFPLPAQSAPTALEDLPLPVEAQLPAEELQVTLASGAVWMDTDGPGRRTPTLPNVLTVRADQDRQLTRPRTSQPLSRRSPSRPFTMTSHSSSTDPHVSPPRPATTTHHPAPLLTTSLYIPAPPEGDPETEEDIQALRRQLNYR